MEEFEKIKSKHQITEKEKQTIVGTLYTILQSTGAGLDLLVNLNSARKHVGNCFEELLIKAVFGEVGISSKKITLKTPYETEEGAETYKYKNDLVLSPFEEVNSSSKLIVVLSVKTTSKDRMGKIFIDKMLLERFVGHPLKEIGIFLKYYTLKLKLMRVPGYPFPIAQVH
ncbi:MAG: hypothetical protein L3J31_01605 [Bacteroidales bacterium]|nr:hypothetical protein [Bacteroidales bacterium]